MSICFQLGCHDKLVTLEDYVTHHAYDTGLVEGILGTLSTIVILIFVLAAIALFINIHGGERKDDK